MTQPGSQFIQKLSEVIASSLDNNYCDNFDFFRFGAEEREIVNRSRNLTFVLSNLDSFSSVCNSLCDQSSKDLFLLLTVFSILGHKKVKLPLVMQNHFAMIDELNTRVRAGNDWVDAGLFDWKLHLTDLSFLHLPIKLYSIGGVVYVTFVLRHYEHHAADHTYIGAKAGDVVIDAGACWGETALCFAHQVGPAGRVYSFEFTGNIDIFNRNISLNPDLAARIDLTKKAVWENSQDVLYFKGRSPGTAVNTTYTGNAQKVSSVSIDDFVSEKKIEKVDFIKMDIEGAEQKALQVALQTITRFKPQLAISIYHKPLEDFIQVPLLISGLKLGYKLYVGHFSAHQEETVLFATL